MNENPSFQYIDNVINLVQKAEDQKQELFGYLTDLSSGVGSDLEKNHYALRMAEFGCQMLLGTVSRTRGVQAELQEVLQRLLMAVRERVEEQKSLQQENENPQEISWSTLMQLSDQVEQAFFLWRDELRDQVGERVRCLLEDLCVATEVTRELGFHRIYDADKALSWLCVQGGYLAAGVLTADGQMQKRNVRIDDLQFVGAESSEIIWLTIGVDLLDNEQILKTVMEFPGTLPILLANMMITTERRNQLKGMLEENGLHGISIDHDNSRMLLIDRRERKYAKQICIYVVTHKEFRLPADPMYQPIHAGKNSGPGFGYPGDDTGNHISDWNSRLNEATALYWIWKNDTHPFVGINHYRRYFSWQGLSCACDPPDEEFLLSCLQTSDILTWEPYFTAPKTVEWQFSLSLLDEGEALVALIREVLRSMLRKHQPEYEVSFLEVMRGYSFIPRNIFVTRKPIFNEYCAWLFSFLQDATEEIWHRMTKEQREKYPRLMGFVAERLFSVWLNRQNYRIRVLHGYFLDNRETESENQSPNTV